MFFFLLPIFLVGAWWFKDKIMGLLGMESEWKKYENLTDAELEALATGPEAEQQALHKACEDCKNEYSNTTDTLLARQTRFCGNTTTNVDNTVCGNAFKMEIIKGSKETAEALGELKDKVVGAATTATGKVGDAVKKLAEKTGSAVEKVRGQASQTFEDTGSLVSESAAQLGDLARDTTQSGSQAGAAAVAAVSNTASSGAETVSNTASAGVASVSSAFGW